MPKPSKKPHPHRDTEVPAMRARGGKGPHKDKRERMLNYMQSSNFDDGIFLSDVEHAFECGWDEALEDEAACVECGNTKQHKLSCSHQTDPQVRFHMVLNKGGAK